MSSSFDINGIQNTIINTFQSVVDQISEWMGRAVAVLKSGVESTLPYFQDKRVAAVSLVAVTLLLCECVIVVGHLCKKYSPNETALQRTLRDVLNITTGTTILVAGVAGFAKYAKLPFSPWVIIGISAGTIVFRSSLQSNDFD